MMLKHSKESSAVCQGITKLENSFSDSNYTLRSGFCHLDKSLCLSELYFMYSEAQVLFKVKTEEYILCEF